MRKIRICGAIVLAVVVLISFFLIFSLEITSSDEYAVKIGKTCDFIQPGKTKFKFFGMTGYTHFALKGKIIMKDGSDDIVGNKSTGAVSQY